MSEKSFPIISVISAHDLSADQRKLAQSILQQRVGECEVEFVVEASILGGVQVKIGDQVFDATLAGQLQELSLSSNNCVVTTAVPLTKTQREKLTTSVRTRHGSFHILEVVDPSVLGGIKVVIGSTEYDHTLQGKLRSLQSQAQRTARS